ncbi:MAG: alpha/beta hydrolase [Chloroflexota bacterium]|nr:alpha/beta hydrolase [Chloroflexota bacterium]
MTGEVSTARHIAHGSGFAPAAGTEIYFEWYGDGPALLLAHGLGGSHLTWWQNIPSFLDAYRVIVLDHRGFGRSIDTPQVGTEALALDVQAVLDHLGIERAHLVGQSMGGWAIAGFALRWPHRVRSLVLTDTIGGIVDDVLRKQFHAYIATAGQTDLATLPLGYHPMISPGFTTRRFDLALLRHQFGLLYAPPPESARRRLLGEHDPAAMRALDIPALLAVGSDDPIFPPPMIRRLARYFPHSRVRVIRDAGHSAHYERPDAWGRIVRPFLDEVTREGIA